MKQKFFSEIRDPQSASSPATLSNSNGKTLQHSSAPKDIISLENLPLGLLLMGVFQKKSLLWLKPRQPGSRTSVGFFWFEQAATGVCSSYMSYVSSSPGLHRLTQVPFKTGHLSSFYLQPYLHHPSEYDAVCGHKQLVNHDLSFGSTHGYITISNLK